ncbi:MAG: hypothetical protein GWN29_11665 [Gammaproteobacteria bacterium]|nr:hypothetical protein [Gammaproteobacteria bacterium]
MDNNERERLLQERVRARGFEMRKSRGAAPPANHGEYMVYDPVTGGSLLGHQFDATLADIERWLPEE